MSFDRPPPDCRKACACDLVWFNNEVILLEQKLADERFARKKAESELRKLREEVALAKMPVRRFRPQLRLVPSEESP